MTRKNRGWIYWLTVVGSVASIIGLLAYFAEGWSDGTDFRMEVWADTQIPPSLDSRLDIRFRGESVENIANILVKIENAGEAEFDKTDFDGPIEFQVQGVREILFAELVGTYPVGVEFDVTYTTNNIVQVRPGLLNAGDFGEIKVIANCEREPNIVVSLNRARIKGVQHPKIIPSSEGQQQLQRRTLSGIGVSVLWGLFGFACYPIAELLEKRLGRIRSVPDDET